MNRIDRITAILIQLQSRKIVKAQDIADRFDISLRTVYRDINTLEEAGIPIIGEAGVGYSIMQGYRLPPIMFTKEEATAFATAEKLLTHITDKATAEKYQEAMYKIRAVLRSDEKDMLEDIEDVIHIYKPPKRNSPKYIYDLLQSISDKKSVEIIYYANHSGVTSKRLIEPVGIYYIGSNWHLIAWCTLRNDYRDFRLDRIEQLQHTSTNFVQEKMSLSDYMSRYLSRNQLIQVVVSFDKRIIPYIDEQKFFFGYTSEVDKGDCIEMTFLTSSLPYMARWLISYGKMLTVLEPTDLINELKKFTEELKDHYL